MNNRTHRPERTLPGHLLAALFLSSLPVVAQTLSNPGFEANSFNAGTFPGYISGALNGPITGWTGTPTNRVGLNPAAGSPFANNGAIPGGTNVAFLQAGTDGVASLKTTATGLTPGVKYNVSFRVNARYHATIFNIAYLTFSTDGTGPTTTAEVSRVSTVVDGTPYRYAAFEFTATAASHEITISNAHTANDNTLLVDDFVIAPSSNAWSFSEWTGDADSGIDSQYVYTHAYKLGADAGVVVNGVPFTGRETNTPGRFAIGGLTGTAGFPADVLQVTGDSATLATTFRHGGVPSITLQGLKPSTQYVFTIYGAGWDGPTDADPYRAATFSSSLGGDKYTVNLNHFGKGHGIIVKYTYTTDALGSDVVINYPATGSSTNGVPVVFHTSAFSNREAVASTPASPWTTAAWSDDATSGVDNTRLYTHAYSFGSATNANINGVAFTGIAGGNPTTATYSSSLPANFTNDTNNAITGTSVALSRDFVYGAYPESHTLTGLTPGKQYVFTIYSTGWEAPAGRRSVFFGNAGDPPAFLDQDEFGLNNGIRFEYRYTANASGTLKVLSSALDGSSTIHCCGISNREADPLASTAPTITLQPVGATIGAGLNYVLRVGVIGSPNLTYQWKRNNDPIPSATSPVLELTAVDFTDAGDYTVTITNDITSVTSDVATLAVLDNISGIASTGLGLDGQPLAAGEIDPHFTLIANPDNPDSSTAFVESNIPGAWVPNSETSRWIGPRIDTSGALGSPAADGEGPGTYVYRTQVDLTNYDLSSVVINGNWATDNSGLAIRVNGTAVPGLVNNTGGTYGALKAFTISSANATLTTGINTLDFVVQNEANGLTGLRIEGLSAVGTLPPNTPPHISFPPVATAGKHGATVMLGVAASGSPPLSYQWYYNDQEVAGETSPTISVVISGPEVAGNYKVKVTNGVSSVTSANVALTVPNGNPTPDFDTVTTPRDTPLLIDVLDLLANDTDPDGDVLDFTAVSATSAAGGTVVESGGTITYTPPAGFTGEDDFTYTVNDGIWGGTGTGHVLITVTPPSSGGGPGPVTLVLSGGTATGSFTGTPGASYILQRSVDLITWLDIDTKIAAGDGSVQVVDPAPPALRAFYRISYTP